MGAYHPGHPAEDKNLPKSIINGCFFFKASHAQELMEDKTTQPIQVEVVKVLQLTAQQFRDFSANLLRDVVVDHYDLKLRQSRSQQERQ